MNDASAPTAPADPNSHPNPNPTPNPNGRTLRASGSQRRRRRSRETAAAAAAAAADDSTRDDDTTTTTATGSRARSRQRPSLSQKAKEGLAQKLSCSFFRLMIRWVAQSLFISPRSEETFLNVPNYHVSAILAPNVICILLHLLTALPFAGEASRGYLHGGVLIDFIGQKAPTSRLGLLLLDFVVFGLQCLMVAVNMERDRIRKVVKPPRILGAIAAAAAAATAAAAGGDSEEAAAANPVVTTQDHDAEERGVLRDAPTLDETDDIEMQPLGGRGGGRGGSDQDDSGDERAELLDRGPISGSGSGSAGAGGNEYDGLLDVLRSGNAIMSTFHVRQALRDTWNNRGSTPESAAAYTLQNVGYNATLAALAAQRRARLAAAAHQT